MMTPDSHNNLFGRTLNPHRLSLSAGGSSGGEGALLAMKGSIIGVGTDIASSIRIPAYVNGMIGFRPTSRRVPYGGQKSSVRPGGFSIFPAAGPLAKTVRDVDYFMSNLLAFDSWTLDAGVISVPWRYVEPIEKTLRFGVINEEPSRPLHPTIQRTMELCLTKLDCSGHVIIYLNELPKSILLDASMVAHKMFCIDPKRTAYTHIYGSGEPVVPSISTAWPVELKDFQPSVDDIFQLNVEQAEIHNLVREQFVKNQLDAIILPVYQATAVPHDTYGLAIYTVFANLLDVSFPSLTYIPYPISNSKKKKKIYIT
jgi:amidase